MINAPEILCQIPLPDGRLIGVRASASPLAAGETLQTIKIKAGINPDLRESLLDAREMEWDSAESWRVTFSLESPPGITLPPDFLDFAAIVADRAVRGVFYPDFTRLIALGYSNDWVAGRLKPHEMPLQRDCLNVLLRQPDWGEALILLPIPADEGMDELHDALRKKHPLAIVRELNDLSSLGGRSLVQKGYRQQQVWFPVVGGSEGEDKLVSLMMTLHQLESPDNPESVQISGLPEMAGAQSERLIKLISNMWKLDAHGSNEWNTHLHFERGFEGDSCELAVVLADRIARGREFPAKGRLIATGSVDDLSRVTLPTDSCERKCKLILKDAKEGDRVLLPAAWTSSIPVGFMGSLLSKGASCVLLERVL